MPHAAKIATCCYCGTRAALVLRGRERHELSCSNCGAPLHDMKMLKAPVSERAPRPRNFEARPKTRPKRKKKRSKSLSQRFMKEVWDVAEDLFDDIFD